jgi:DNA repair protein RecN (Recombination protein N)
MLSSLYIQNIVLIDRLSLAIGDGLTALTGETGAGKSILLDALALATGGRAERALLRHGASQAVVSASFEPPQNHPAWQALAQNGLADDDEQEIILRRVMGEDGHARAFINDHPVSVALLRQVGESLIEVHGQHQGIGFLDSTAHRGLLDAYGGLQTLGNEVAQKYQAMTTARSALDENLKAKQRAMREADYLRHVVDELAQIAPQDNEETELAETRAHLMAAEKISKDVEQVAKLVEGDSTVTALTRAAAGLERASAQLSEEKAAPLKKLATQIDSVLSEWHEAGALANSVAQDFLANPQELNRVEERLFALRAAARKFNVPCAQLAALLEQARADLALIEEDAASMAALEKKLFQAEQDYDRAAQKLFRARQKAAAQLDRAVAKELAPLKLDKAKFVTEVKAEEGQRKASGCDAVQFLISTNPGAPLGPLKQIASGGELSRFVLAMKAALMSKEERTVIIFDEVDAGVSGAVADAVGERLAKLAGAAQVLVVTHSPQVAARGAVHWRISKSGSKKMITKVEKLDEDERIEEIARMVAGAKVTPAAREAAKSLLGVVTAKKAKGARG